MMRFIIIVILSSLSMISMGQSLEIQASLDTNLLLIGEQVKLHIHVKAEEQQKVTWPSIQDSLGGLEIINIEKIDTQQTGNWITYHQSVLLTAFDSGYYKIPNLEIGLNEGKAYTQELIIRYNTIEVEPDTQKDIKGPKDVPYPWFYFVIAGLLVLIIIGLGVYFYLRSQDKADGNNQRRNRVPKIPPHVIALNQLHGLLEEKTYLEQENTKSFYSALTEIVRHYLHQRYAIRTLERVSDEIINDLDALPIHQDQKIKIAKILRHADAIKFAKGSALTTESEQYIKDMIDFVNSTIPSPNPSAENE